MNQIKIPKHLFLLGTPKDLSIILVKLQTFILFAVVERLCIISSKYLE